MMKLSNTVKAGYNNVRYNKVLDIVKHMFGPWQNPSLCHQKIVGYAEFKYNVMPLIEQFFG